VQAFVIYEDGTAGSHEQGIRLTDKTMSIAERLGHLGAIFILLCDRVRESASLGDLASVDALGPQIVDVCRRGGLPWLYVGHLYVGLAAHWRGDTGRAESELRQAVELEPPGAYAGQSASILARHLAHSGRTDEVWALYESSRSMFPSAGRVNSVGAWNCMLGMVEALYLSGFRDEVARLAPLIDQALEIGPDWVTFDCRLVRTRAGMAAAAARRWEAAERHFIVAQQHAERMPNRLETADLRRLRARMLLDRAGPDDVAQAAGLLTEALSEYRGFGMPGYVSEVERLLAETQAST
jgi:tetratricopeptide (TPR) repeat protein